MAIYVAQQFNQVEESSELNVFLSDNMDEAASGAGTPASEMGVSVGGEGLSVRSEDVSNINNNEEGIFVLSFMIILDPV
ncbi:hypothetical protein G6F56_014264 [Rhizopus delemar]|nr:hypothetical protein G6F56_014264 [Rhizopus delemar]